MDIVEKVKLWKCQPPKKQCKGDALDYCECKDIDELIAKVERLQSALQAVVDAHGTGQGIGAQGAGSWLDQARQALEDK